MHRVSSHGATFIKSIRHIRVLRSPLYQHHIASYHATNWLHSNINFSGLELAKPDLNAIFNRPILRKGKTAVLKYGKMTQEAPAAAFNDATAFYKARVGTKLYNIFIGLWACRYDSMRRNYSPRDEALACLLCAETSSRNLYPSIYYEPDRYADSLYLMGKLDLERGSEHRDSARYSLDTAAELGHLDAALLLHRLSLADRSVTAGQAAESVIKRAKGEGDSRAMIAYIEQTQLRRIEKMTWQDIESTVADLYEMMQSDRESYRSSEPESSRTRLPNLMNGQVDTDALETFDPPARLLWQLCRYHYNTIVSQQGERRDNILRTYVDALQVDTTLFQNPEAMYGLISLPEWLRPQELIKHDQNWIFSVQQAAEAGIPEAKINNGFWLLDKSALFPTLAAQTNQYRPVYEGWMKLRHHEEAFDELRAAAKDYSDGQPDITGYLYLIMAGILSENGLHREGQNFIKEGIECMADATIAQGLDIKRVRACQKLPALLRDLNTRWPTYETKGLYDEIRPAKLMENPIIAEILMLPDSSEDQ